MVSWYLCAMSHFDDQLQFLVQSAFREDLGDGDHTDAGLHSSGSPGKGRT